LLGDDLVGVNVGAVKRRDDRLVSTKRFHTTPPLRSAQAG
jgi:hypothetical protein